MRSATLLVLTLLLLAMPPAVAGWEEDVTIGLSAEGPFRVSVGFGRLHVIWCDADLVPQRWTQNIIDLARYEFVAVRTRTYETADAYYEVREVFGAGESEIVGLGNWHSVPFATTSVVDPRTCW